MSDEVVPSLSDDPEQTPVERPVKSRSVQRREAIQKGQPMPKFGPPEPEILVVSPPAPKVTQPAEPALPPAVPKVYAKWRVVESQEVFRGASSFLLHREQVLSEQHFDVPGLLKLGVKLERLPE